MTGLDVSVSAAVCVVGEASVVTDSLEVVSTSLDVLVSPIPLAMMSPIRIAEDCGDGPL